jgi:hypothetical protein
MKRDERKVLKSFSLKVNKKARIDLHLKEGLFERSNHASYINQILTKNKENMIEVMVLRLIRCMFFCILEILRVPSL